MFAMRDHIPIEFFLELRDISVKILELSSIDSRATIRFANNVILECNLREKAARLPPKSRESVLKLISVFERVAFWDMPVNHQY